MTALIYHPLCLEHKNPQGHPERSERLSATLKLLEERKIISQLELISTKVASEEIIGLVHDKGYIDNVRDVARSGGGYLDADTFVSPSSYEAAKMAVGGVLAGIDNLMSGKNDNVFCLVRPPGHHATTESGMGFCIFDNLAVGARYAINKHKVSKVLIIDWDAHHGNGIQDIFYRSQEILYISLHQFPHYPGTGGLEEVGEGEGEGYTVNIPLPAGSGDDLYLQAFDKIIMPLAAAFEAQLVMVAAGYDGHFADPLASLNLTTSGYARMTGEILSLAAFSGKKVIVSLEGGYELTALSYSVLATIAQLAGLSDPVDDPFDSVPRSIGLERASEGRKILDLVARHLNKYWEF